MEADQELKHVCKFCSKSFPCGRSLGGHMRSHVTTNGSSDQAEKLAATMKKKKKHSSSASSEASGYGLRENRKRTWRLEDSAEEAMMVFDNLCKECGKGFHSLKALFGHMKCHSSEKERVSTNNNSFGDQDSWNNNNAGKNQKVFMMDSQSDSEATAPNRRKRSKRRRTRYVMNKVASSLSFAANPCSSVSEAEQEEEEEVAAAMSLIMLSRDGNPWWGGLNSVAESSHNKHLDLEAPSFVPIATKPVSKIEGKRVINLVSSNLKTSESPGNGSRVINGFVKNVKDEKHDSESAFKVNEAELVLPKWKNLVNKPNSEAELSCKNNRKRGKFECTTCNKIFHSYQALGGHRASHKRVKGCFASKVESIELEAEAEAELSPDNNEYLEEHELGAGFDDEYRKSKEHECPISLKVFPSGPALGGHKRSYFAAESENSTRNCETQSVVVEEAVPEIRDFLDLNLPAATEEGRNSHVETEPYRPWWVVGCNHKQEALPV